MMGYIRRYNNKICKMKKSLSSSIKRLEELELFLMERRSKLNSLKANLEIIKNKFGLLE